MKKIVVAKDFQEYFNKTDSIVAASIAQEHVETFLQNLIKDPTKEAKGEFAEGYRSCLRDIMGELERK